MLFSWNKIMIDEKFNSLVVDDWCHNFDNKKCWTHWPIVRSIQFFPLFLKWDGQYCRFPVIKNTTGLTWWFHKNFDWSEQRFQNTCLGHLLKSDRVQEILWILIYLTLLQYRYSRNQDLIPLRLLLPEKVYPAKESSFVPVEILAYKTRPYIQAVCALWRVELGEKNIKVI